MHCDLLLNAARPLTAGWTGKRNELSRTSLYQTLQTNVYIQSRDDEHSESRSCHEDDGIRVRMDYVSYGAA